MKDETKGALIGIAVLPILVPLLYVVIFPFLMLRAWCVWLLYGWFLQPLGLPHISYWGVVGVLLFWAVLRNSSDTTTKKGEKWYMPVARAFALLLVALLAVLAGFVIKGWM